MHTWTRRSFPGFALTEVTWIGRSTKPSELGYATTGPSERLSTTGALRNSAENDAWHAYSCRSADPSRPIGAVHSPTSVGSGNLRPGTGRTGTERVRFRCLRATVARSRFTHSSSAR